MLFAGEPQPDAAVGMQDVPILTSTREVRSLDRSVATKELPVRVRGVVTFCYPNAVVGIMIEHEGVGIWVSSSKADIPGRQVPGSMDADVPAFLHADTKAKAMIAAFKQLETGQEVEVCGVTVPGGYAPSIAAVTLRVLGRKSLPPPPGLDPSRFLTGSLDSQRVRVEGVIQNAEYSGEKSTRMILTLAMAGHQFPVRVIERGAFRLEDWVGARIEATALCSGYFNERAELLGPFLTTTDFSTWRLLVPPPKDPFAVPVVSLGHMLPFSPDDPILTRQRLIGTISLCRSGEFIMIEGNDRAVRVNTTDAVSFTPGDIVEASGFVELRHNFAELTGAVIRKIGEGKPPVPTAQRIDDVFVKIDATQALDHTPKDYYGRLVTFEALLQLNEPWEGGRRLVCSSDNRSFTAVLDGPSGAGAIAGLRPNSRLLISGVCDLQYSESHPSAQFAYPTGVTLLMRSPADIVVTHAASWWTATRLLMALGGTALFLVGALLWAGQLRRRVADQGEIIGKQMAHVTLHEERTRMARELHDTLDQELMGVSLQLDAAHDVMQDSPDKAQRALVSAQALLKHTRSEARRSIWDLRNAALEEADLLGALSHSLQQFGAPDVPEISLEMTGIARRLPYRIETNLLRMTTEAATNAVKHARAKHIRITLAFEPEEVVLSTTDDGCGFDATSLDIVQEGHFGLLGMRERAQQMGATLDIQSRPGGGTHVRVRLPDGESNASFK